MFLFPIPAFDNVKLKPDVVLNYHPTSHTCQRATDMSTLTQFRSTVDNYCLAITLDARRYNCWSFYITNMIISYGISYLHNEWYIYNYVLLQILLTSDIYVKCNHIFILIQSEYMYLDYPPAIVFTYIYLY